MCRSPVWMDYYGWSTILTELELNFFPLVFNPWMISVCVPAHTHTHSLSGMRKLSLSLIFQFSFISHLDLADKWKAWKFTALMRFLLPRRCVCNIDCSHISYNPVCASDGRSYDNPCQVKEASCQKQERIEVKHLGHCQGQPPQALAVRRSFGVDGMQTEQSRS